MKIGDATYTKESSGHWASSVNASKYTPTQLRYFQDQEEKKKPGAKVNRYAAKSPRLPSPNVLAAMKPGSEVRIPGGSTFKKEGKQWVEYAPSGDSRFSDTAELRSDMYNYGGQVVEKGEKIPGGLASGKKPEDFDQKQLAMGIKVEMEHTNDRGKAREIAMDHLVEDSKYYTHLAEMERKHGMKKSGDLTPEKAKQILRDGEVHGHPLTDQQKKFFGAIAGGQAPQQKSQAPISAEEEERMEAEREKKTPNNPPSMPATTKSLDALDALAEFAKGEGAAGDVGRRSPPKGYPKSKDQYGDPENWKYPLDTEDHVRAAISYFSQPSNANQYPVAKRKTIWGRIKAAAKRVGIELGENSGPPSVEKSDDGKPGESLQETSTDELKRTHQQIIARLKGDPNDAAALQKRRDAIAAELARRQPPDFGGESEKGCDTPGMKIRSGGKGQGMARGGGRGPIGRMGKSDAFDALDVFAKGKQSWGDQVLATGKRGGKIYGYDSRGNPIYTPKSKAKAKGKPADAEKKSREYQAARKAFSDAAKVADDNSVNIPAQKKAGEMARAAEKAARAAGNERHAKHYATQAKEYEGRVERLTPKRAEDKKYIEADRKSVDAANEYHDMNASGMPAKALAKKASEVAALLLKTAKAAKAAGEHNRAQLHEDLANDYIKRADNYRRAHGAYEDKAAQASYASDEYLRAKDRGAPKDQLAKIARRAAMLHDSAAGHAYDVRERTAAEAHGKYSDRYRQWAEADEAAGAGGAGGAGTAQELDKLVDQLDDPNLRGFARRIPESKHYRAPPKGSPADVPSKAEVQRHLEAARMQVARKEPAGKAARTLPAAPATAAEAKARLDKLFAKLPKAYLTDVSTMPAEQKFDLLYEAAAAIPDAPALRGSLEHLNPDADDRQLSQFLGRVLMRADQARDDVAKQLQTEKRKKAKGSGQMKLFGKSDRPADLAEWYARESDMQKSGGPFIGPRGGKWADAKHTIPWDEEKHGKGGGKAGGSAVDKIPGLAKDMSDLGKMIEGLRDIRAGKKVENLSEAGAKSTIEGLSGAITNKITNRVRKLYGAMDSGEAGRGEHNNEIMKLHDLRDKLKMDAHAALHPIGGEKKKEVRPEVQKVVDYFKALREGQVSKVDMGRIMADTGLNLEQTKDVVEHLGREIKFKEGGDPRGYVEMAHGKGEPGESGDHAKVGGNEPPEKKTAKKSEVSEMSGIDQLTAYVDNDGDLEKAQTMPQGNPKQKLGQGPEQGGELAGVGETSGSNTSGGGPGQDKDGQVTGTKLAKDKLSEDEEEDEANMKPHKKPIETAKSVNPGRQREMVAQEHAQVVTRLRKGKSDVPITGTGLPEQVEEQKLEKGRVGRQGMVVYTEQSDIAAEALLKSDDFYSGGAPRVIPFSRPIGTGQVCLKCGTLLSKSLTACPTCGNGTVVHQVRPGGEAQGDHDGEPIVKSRAGKLKPRHVEDVKIGK